MTIFDQTYAVFSSQFMEEFHDFRKNAMFQKICDCVGVVHVHDGGSDKLLGSWESVKKAHDMLTAFLFFRSLNTPMPGTNGSAGGPCDVPFIEGTSEAKEQIFSPTNGSISSTNIEKNLRETPSLAMDADIDVHGMVEDDDESFELDFHYKSELCKVKPQLDLDGRTVYVCDICSYVGHKRHNLVVHKIRSHIRPYKCRKCSRGFGLRKDLRRHHKNKRNCVTYGRDYKQHCEGRSRLSDFHLLKIAETSQPDTVHLKDSVSKDSIGIANGKENNTNQQNQSILMEADQSSNVQEENEMLVSRIKQSEPSASQDQLESNVHSEQEQTAHEKSKDASLRSASDAMATATSQIPSSTAAQVTDKSVHFAKIKFEPVESSSGLFEQVKTKDGVQFQCLACKFVSSKKQQVEDHTKRVHCKQFKCSVCGSMFGMRKDLNRHYRRSHNMHLNCRKRSQLELHFCEKK